MALRRLRTYPEVLQDFWIRIGIESYRRGEYDLSEYFLSKVWNLKVADEIPEAVPLYLAQLYLRKDRKDDARKLILEYTYQHWETRILLHDDALDLIELRQVRGI